MAIILGKMLVLISVRSALNCFMHCWRQIGACHVVLTQTRNLCSHCSPACLGHADWNGMLKRWSAYDR